MAADLREELGAEVQVENGHYGEFRVLVDGEEVVNGGALAFLGVLPSVSDVRKIVASRTTSASSREE